LTLANDKDGERRRKSSPPSDTAPTSQQPRARRKRADTPVGSALRSAYQQTVDEDVPAEMLDLLGKLGI
jgi:hypothetical protein